MFAAFQQSMSFATFSTDTVTEPDRRAAIAGLFAAASRGELHAVMDELLPLEQAVLAHQKMAAGEVSGVYDQRTGRGKHLPHARKSCDPISSSFRVYDGISKAEY